MTFLNGLFLVLAAITLIGVPALAWRVRGRTYALFAAIVLALSLPGAIFMHQRLMEFFAPVTALWLGAGFAYSMAAAGLHLASLVRPRLRPAWIRLAVSVPGQAFLAAGALSAVWLLALLPIRALLGLAGMEGALDLLRWVEPAPLVIAALSIATSTRLRDEVVRIEMEPHGPEEVTRVPVQRYRRRRAPEPLVRRPLRIVQIADPHLGPWQPIAKLRSHIQELIAREPDLVLLTGDFLTMEGQETPGALREALEPLKQVTGRSFAIFGNHDHEAPDEVRSALAAAGVRLLVDEETVTDTPVGPVQIVGADYAGRDRARRIRALLERHPRRDGHLRIFLLHDPLGFQDIPKGEVDLTLSGHTHGGQLGLVSFGLDWTVLARTPWPDHGLFGHGPNRLYVHRGTGFYGFPLRIGVPGEASLLEVVLPG